MWKKILGLTVLLAVVGVAAVFGYLYTRKPATAPPLAIKIEMTPERIERGRYIFQFVSDCDGCHSERDLGRFGGPVVASGRGKGITFPPEMGLPGVVVASNITPDRETGIGEWTDGEKIRAIRDGIGRDGRALFPMMPYASYRRMSDDDVYAVVAYLNSLAPVRNSLPKTQIDFPISLLIKSVPQPAGSIPPPNREDKLKHGEYLVTMGGCLVCHTKTERGQPVPGMRLAGGSEFRTPFGVVISANISPDVETGLGKWTEKQFIDKFYEYREYAEKGSPPVGPEGFTLMPWLGLSQLSAEELGAIFAYLKSQPAVRKAVETHPGQPKKAA
jgi:mono/diheme cytochrome c family protein